MNQCLSGRILGLAALGLILTAGAASSEARRYALPEETAQLRPGPDPGFSAAQANCQSCHSPDYVAMQPPRKGKAFWEAEVTKMIKVYHAPISEADSKAITDYLTQAY